MFSLMISMIIILMISIIVMLLSNLISKKALYDREKTSPFECGFEPFNSSRMPFSLRFFLIAIIFLIFDVEIALMFPLITTLKINDLLIWSITCMIFILILTIGLFHEWNQGALEWSN